MKIAFGMLAVAGLAAAASADFITVPQNHRMMSAVASQLDSVQIETTVLYSSIPGPYSAFGVASFASNDDYTTTTGGAGQFECDQLRFVGGVGQVGGILDFFFLDSTGTNVISSFGVTLGSAGDFIWTITNIGELADHTGRLQIQTRGSTTGRWFMTTTAPSAGSNSLTTGLGSALAPQRIAAFELNTPTPGSLALLGLGGLAAARRRR